MERCEHFQTACRFRRDGRLADAIHAFEECLQVEGDSDAVWSELALTQYQAWHAVVTRAHKASIVTMNVQQWADALPSTTVHVGGSLLQEAYNSFIVAMEYPANKKNPQLLAKLVRLYLEYQAYSGALSVCTLLVEVYAKSDVFREAVFLCAISAKALRKHKESAHYFQYVAETPPFRLAAYQLHLLAALEMEAAGGMKDQMRVAFSEAYKAMIGLSPVTASEKAAYQIYKTSHKNENQRLQMWFHDDTTWLDLAARLGDLNFPLLACSVLQVVLKRAGRAAMPRDVIILEAVCRYRLGEYSVAESAISEALKIEYWCRHARFLARKFSDAWKKQFDLEECSAARLQREYRRQQRRRRWHDLADSLRARKQCEAAITIQCAWRQQAARKALSDLWVLQRLREEEECLLMSKEDWQVILRKWNLAADKIQSLHKIFTAKQELRLRRGIRAKHSRIISSFSQRRSTTTSKAAFGAWRRFVRLQNEERHDAARVIQRLARRRRAWLVYKRLLAAKARQERIVVECLDRRAASTLRRMMCKWIEYTFGVRDAKRLAAARIQNKWRCYQQRLQYRRELHRHMVAMEIIHQTLATKATRRLRETWNALAANALWHRMRKHRAAVAIQRRVRGVLACQRVRRLRSRRRRVEVVVQSMRSRSNKQVLRRVVDGWVRFVEMQWEARHASAIHVQRVFRGYATRKRIRFIVECNAILKDPTMTLRGQPDAYVLRVSFLLLARLLELNRMERVHSTRRIQSWYRHAARRRRLIVALAKLQKQRSILNTLTMTFRSMACLFFAELKKRVQAKRWRHDRMAKRIQRAAIQWLTYRRYQRVLNKRADKKTLAAAHAHSKQLVFKAKSFRAWHCLVSSEKNQRTHAAVQIQQAYRARMAKRQAQRILAKRAARQRLMASLHLKPLENCFRLWEERMIERAVLAVRGSVRSPSHTGSSPDKWKCMIRREESHASRSPFKPMTLDQRAELPSLVFYTLLNRVRQSGILQLAPVTGLSCITPSQLQQLLGFATSVIVDGGDSSAVELVVEAMESVDRGFPIQKLIFFNARLSAAHAAKLQSVFKHPAAVVTSLVLSNVRLTSAAVVALATSLCHGHSKLEQLVLEGCGIGSAGGAAVFEALNHTLHLWKLDLSHNHIGDSACASFANVLVTNTSLRILALSGNVISDRGVIGFLVPALERVMGSPSSRLESVVLRESARITPLARHVLQQATTHRRGLVHVD